MYRIVATAIILLFTLPMTVSAQLSDSSLTSSEPFTVSISPLNPAPYSSATISFTSSLINLTNATLRVTQNGTSLYEGNVQPVSLTLGRGGSASVINVTITQNGTPYTKKVILQPQDVSLIAEPLSSAPLLYPGKSLVPLEGNTRVVAVANLRDAAGKTVDPAKLSYVWSVDGTQISSSSGIGKQVLLVASPLQYRSRDVSVVVRSQDGNLVGSDSLSLTPVEPTLRIYENDPLLGIRFERALLGSYEIQNAEMSLFAAPFSLSTTEGTPTTQWFLNGNPAQTGDTITLRPAGSGEGRATLSLTSSGAASSLATAVLSLIFGANQSSNIFGL